MRKRAVLMRLLGMALPFWRGMLLAALLGALTIASSVSLMATSAWLISSAALRPSMADLSVAVVGVRFFGIARGVLRYLERLASHETTFRLLAHWRTAFYDALEPLAPARLVSASSGDLLARVMDDIEGLQNVYLRAAAPPLVALVSGLLLAGLLAAFDLLLALAATAFMLAAGIVVPLVTYAANAHGGARVVETRAALNRALVDGIQGMTDVLVYGQAEQQIEQVRRLGDELARQEQQQAHADALQAALGVLLTSAAAMTVLALAIPRIEGVLLATVTLATMAVFEAFQPLAQAALHLGATAQAGARLFAIADSGAPVADNAPAAPLPKRPALGLRGVSFRYTPDGIDVLRDISLRLDAGQRAAVLGASGAGKSSLIHVLLRFWDYTQGSITLGGRDLRDYAHADVRALFGVMTQRTHLFNTTIRENLRIARPDAPQDAIETAARQAAVHNWITALPDGYDTYVGENGVLLSGGERQRIALARVLLKGAPILLLDEVTAHLDTVTERAVLETILDAAAERSVLMLTHRRVLLERMDAVYVLRAGRLERQ